MGDPDHRAGLDAQKPAQTKVIEKRQKTKGSGRGSLYTLRVLELRGFLSFKGFKAKDTFGPKSK